MGLNVVGTDKPTALSSRSTAFMVAPRAGVQPTVLQKLAGDMTIGVPALVIQDAEAGKRIACTAAYRPLVSAVHP